MRKGSVAAAHSWWSRVAMSGQSVAWRSCNGCTRSISTNGPRSGDRRAGPALPPRPARPRPWRVRRPQHAAPRNKRARRPV